MVPSIGRQRVQPDLATEQSVTKQPQQLHRNRAKSEMSSLKCSTPTDLVFIRGLQRARTSRECVYLQIYRDTHSYMYVLSHSVMSDSLRPCGQIVTCQTPL